MQEDKLDREELARVIVLRASSDPKAAAILAADRTPQGGAARTILVRMFIGHLMSGFGTRELRRHCWPGLHDRRLVNAALMRLSALGYLRVEQTKTTGRTRTRYYLTDAFTVPGRGDN